MTITADTLTSTDVTTTEVVADTTPKSAGGGGHVTDYISGRLVPAGPEELEATQPFSRQLVEDYGYPKEDIQTRPQFCVKSKPSGSFDLPIDIAVFGGPEHDRDDLYIAVECKRLNTRPEGGDDRQLYNYMAFSSAQLGVWTDGFSREVWRKVITKTGQLSYELIPTLPRYGESIDAIGKYRRENLVAPKNLNTTFRVLRSHLAGNAVGTTRDEMLATQLINIVFCKIYDEKFTKPDELVTFRYQIGDTHQEVGDRIRNLYAKVKTKYPEVFDNQDAITIDDSAIAYVVGELQAFALTEAKRDAVGEAFEVFVGDTLKGNQGQFFTPRNVIRLMVEITNPTPEQHVIDPACGAGGFLVETLRHKWAALDAMGKEYDWSERALEEERQSVAMKSVFGIEKDSFLAKVAKAYMAIMGDGKGGIFCEDSLEKPDNWHADTQRGVKLGHFDLVLANPPFGKDIKVIGEAKLRQFDLGHQHKTVGGAKVLTNTVLKEQNPQVLFVERCIQLAKDGGVIGLILPETYFHAPKPKHVRDFMTQHNVMALIDLPHNTFRPFNNAKCIAIIFQKNRPQQDTIRMIAADQMGHDHRGLPIYGYDAATNQQTANLWDDLATALGDVSTKTTSEFTFSVAAKTVAKADIYVPRYYWPRLTENIEDPTYEVEWKTLRGMEKVRAVVTHAGHGSPEAVHKGRGVYPYIRVKDIINWEIYRDPTSGIPGSIYEALVKKYPLHLHDIVYVSRGSYRIGDAAMVGPDDLEVALTRENHIIRVLPDNKLDLDPFYLLYLLTTPQVALQTKGKVFIDTTLPTIGNRYLDIKLPWAKDPEIRKETAARVRTAVTSRWASIADIRMLLADLGHKPADVLDLIGDEENTELPS